MNNKVKCAICKKISIVFQFKCKCSTDNIYCQLHRNNHNCKYDYKTNSKYNIEKNNPNIVPLKVQKI